MVADANELVADTIGPESEQTPRALELKVPRCGPRMLSSGGQALAGACGRQLHRAVYCIVHLQGESAAHRRLTSILRDLRLDLAMHNHHAKLPARTPARRNRSRHRAITLRLASSQPNRHLAG